jgi:hypothetical protein
MQVHALFIFNPLKNAFGRKHFGCQAQHVIMTLTQNAEFTTLSEAVFLLLASGKNDFKKSRNLTK